MGGYAARVSSDFSSSPAATVLGDAASGGPLLGEELLLLGLAIEGRLGRLLAQEGRPSLLQLRVLALLVRDGEMEPRQAAAALNVHPASLHHTLQQLIHEGSVDQRAHPDDGRRRLLSLTGEGRERYRTLRRPIEQELRALTAQLTEDEERALTHLVDRLRGRLAAAAGEELPPPSGYRGRAGP